MSIKQNWKLIAGGAAIAVITAGATVLGIHLVEKNSVPETAMHDGDAANTEMANLKLDKQFAGPLKDTIIQRWKDPDSGTICFIYMPIVVQHSQPTPTGYVHYGPNGIGSISCLPH